MNKRELIEKIAAQADLNRYSASKALNAALDTIQRALTRGQKVHLVGFGSFSVVNRGNRMGRNLRTGESIKIPARRVPKFSPAKNLKRSVR